MIDKFAVDLDSVAQKLMPSNSHRLADVEHRIEKVAYDLVRFRDNDDTDQLWKIQSTDDGPVIVALYNDNGGLENVESEQQDKKDWEAISDKQAMHIYYKGEPLVSLSSQQLGIPEKEFSLVQRWLPNKLAKDEELQQELLGKVSIASRKLIANRFPELTKVASIPTEVPTFEEEGDIKIAEASADPVDIAADSLKMELSKDELKRLASLLLQEDN